MASLSYAVCMAICHSLWQAALLLCAYTLIDCIFRQHISPLGKRNIIFLLLSAQLLLSVCTFFIYFAEPVAAFSGANISAIAASWLPVPFLHHASPWLSLAYTIAIVFKLTKACVSWYRFKKQYKTGLKKASIELKLFTAARAHQFGIKRNVKLWLSHNVNTPLTFGFLRPVILLPVALVNNISTEQAETLILHELAHIRSNDFLLNWYLISLETIFFFNPAVTRLCRAIRFEREKYCDVNVIAFNYSPLLYAQTLLQAAQMKPLITGFQLAAIQQKKQLLRRIEFFAGNINFKPAKSISITASLLSLTLILALSFNLLFQSRNVSYNDGSAQSFESGTYPVANTAAYTGTINTANELVTNFDDKYLQSLVDKVEKQQPAIEQMLEQMAPLIQSIQDNADEIAKDALAQLVHPAAFKEGTDGSKQIIVREEQSGSKTASIKVYRVIKINGEWVVEPEWMLAAHSQATDSLHLQSKDSLQANFYPADQQ